MAPWEAARCNGETLSQRAVVSLSRSHAEFRFYGRTMAPGIRCHNAWKSLWERLRILRDSVRCVDNYQSCRQFTSGDLRFIVSRWITLERWFATWNVTQYLITSVARGTIDDAGTKWTMQKPKWSMILRCCRWGAWWNAPGFQNCEVRRERLRYPMQQRRSRDVSSCA